jgi:hypothetical protein
MRGAVPSHLFSSNNATGHSHDRNYQGDADANDEAQTARSGACLPFLVFSALSCGVEDGAIIGNILDSHFLTTLISW